MLAAITGEYVRGAAVRESKIHPFRRHFEDMAVRDSPLTHRRTVSEADITAFGGISGDFFYMHFDEIAAKQSQFGQRIAHGYFVLSAAADQPGRRTGGQLRHPDARLQARLTVVRVS